jgi:hypothetical protein
MGYFSDIHAQKHGYFENEKRQAQKEMQQANTPTNDDRPTTEDRPDEYLQERKAHQHRLSIENEMINRAVNRGSHW